MQTDQSKLCIGWVQLDIQWHAPEMNRERVIHLFAQSGQHPDILFLPEMFTTGFTMNPEMVAEQMDGETTQWMLELAHAESMVVAGSIVISQDNTFRNRFVFAFPDGHLSFYDKRHLFNHAGEGESYTEGSDRVLIDYCGWKIMPQVCYDLRFPVWSRNDLNYDLLVYVANWPEPRVKHWDALLVARAIENQSYTLGLNRIGQDDSGLNYIGHSRMIAYDGTTLQQSPSEEGVMVCEINRDEMHQYRDRFRFLHDQDRFLIRDA